MTNRAWIRVLMFMLVLSFAGQVYLFVRGCQ